MKAGGQRIKGKKFERKIAALVRKRWPGALVRRASQAERAHNPDVFIEGGPPILQRLWLELQDAAHPTPSAKLAQAEYDIARDPREYQIGAHRIPVAVTHRRGSRVVDVAIAMHHLEDILYPYIGHDALRFVVSMDLESFLGVIARHAEIFALEGR